jgi:hypothetical protein
MRSSPSLMSKLRLLVVQYQMDGVLIDLREKRCVMRFVNAAKE